ncbi:MAG: hypothetical protein IJW30_06590 [Clostridia bacterium]|nr:hypothetical protein [Clostridia bacterium]MBQ9774316.1 hypothetical protein [Clostridia bacterium]
MVFPRVKCNKQGNPFAWCAPVRVYGVACARMLFVLREMMPYIAFEKAENAKDAIFCTVIDPALSDRAEYYELTVEQGSVTARAGVP